MTSHKHAEMIKAKADNMDLVLFACSNSGWVELSAEELPCNECFNYFVCLPQHKDICLSFLNGGVLQLLCEEWVDACPNESISKEWAAVSVFMLEDAFDMRIKPKKEKRWIVYNAKGEFCSEHDFEYIPVDKSVQVFEIEIEV